ncbi:MAG: hypothetical protein Q9172_002259 [Xanthocarpia lactea]
MAPYPVSIDRIRKKEYPLLNKPAVVWRESLRRQDPGVSSLTLRLNNDSQKMSEIPSMGLGDGRAQPLGLFAYPAQSNMNGRRLPLDWAGRLRRSASKVNKEMYSLPDAAAFVATAQLDLSDPENAPDFTTPSFYKIFGFPDLGVSILRKDIVLFF